MITEENYFDIHKLSRINKLSAKQIAEKMDISLNSVKKWLKEAGYRSRKNRKIESVLDPFKGEIEKLLKEYKYTAVQVFQQISEFGYMGSYNTVQRFVNEVRPVERKPFFKIYYACGEAAQVDFGSCGRIPFGQIERRMSVFVMVLCYSRMIYAEFIPCERLEHFLDCHMNAFKNFHGVPKRIIVDNCKCAVLSNKGGEVEYNQHYRDFAKYYNFEPFACHPYSPHEKGRVENAVGYIKKNFLRGRTFANIQVANSALNLWLNDTANVRIHGTTKKRPVDMFLEEQKVLSVYPAEDYECNIIKIRNVNKFSMLSFDGNDYSVPQYCVGQKMIVKAFPKQVVIVHQKKGVVAIHTRSYDRNCTIIDPDHTDELRKKRKQLKEQNLIKDFLSLGNSAKLFMEKVQEKELAPRTHFRKILQLTNLYSKEQISKALEDALELDTCRYKYVEYLLHLKADNSTSNFGSLHVPRAEDLLEIDLKKPDMNQYEK